MIHPHLDPVGVPLDREEVGPQVLRDPSFPFREDEVNIGLDGGERSF